MSRRWWGIATGLLVVAAACGDAGDPSSATTTVTVFAAASLTDAFTEVGEAFEATHPDTAVTFNFGGSFALANQIGQGAPADVFAAADPEAMTPLVTRGATVFASNTAAIITGPGNPLGITGVADLARPDLVVVGCAPTAGCGRLLDEVTGRAGVSVTPASLEESVRGVVTKVTLGEADVGVVFATDVRAAGTQASGVDLPADQNVLVRYPIAVLDGAADATAAQRFVDFVRSPDGQAILQSYGFGPP